VIYLFIALCLLTALTYIFFLLYPPFGGKTKSSIKERSPNFVKGRFVNQIPTPMGIGIGDIPKLIHKQTERDPFRKPSRLLTPVRLDAAKPVKRGLPRITWFGHSAFLLQMDGENILLDPMLSKSPSPFQSVGPQRFSDSLPATIEDLPHIDFVVISHDHYDHLDYESIRKLAHKTTMFFVPLGLAAHLKKWGVLDSQITELDWWDERVFQGFTLTCTPSRHFSGRTLTDRFATLWCSWVIRTDQTKIFFSGDSGYGPQFKEIGDKYGPFDLDLLECGQYDPLWPNIHMTPEQTMQAHLDLRGKRMIPMHWGAFVLAFHAWTDPVERVLAAGAKAKATIITPKIGEAVEFTSKNYPTERWWEQYNK
jgi:L-ascorbate metabolism protein UlaG (beta-lactamase superfamily)